MITLEQLPVLDDNTIWALGIDAHERLAVVVDPAEAPPVLAWLERTGRRLVAVLCTHHHGDHTGGAVALHEATGCRIVGPAHDLARIPGATEGAVPGEVVVVAGLSLRVLDVRAHTRGHVAFALDDHVDVVIRHGHGGEAAIMPGLAGRPALFVGDSLFGAGCGRLFEGTGAELHAALSTLAQEQPESLVCCAHEYTAGNLRFAVVVRPDVPAIARRQATLPEEMGAARSSLPSTLELELETNPFLLALKGPSPAEGVFALRQQKDTFRA